MIMYSLLLFTYLPVYLLTKKNEKHPVKTKCFPNQKINLVEFL